MTKSRIIVSALFALLAAAVSVFAVFLCVYAIDAPPKIVSETEPPRERTAYFFTCIKERQYAEAEEMIGHGASLGLSTEPADSVGQLVFDALRDSFSFELIGECEVSGVVATQRVKITYLDIPSLTESQKEPTRSTLERYVEEAELSSEVFDESGVFRYDVAIRALYEVTEKLLKVPERFYISEEITVKLSYSGNEWYLEPEAELYRILSGNTSYGA